MIRHQHKGVDFDVVQNRRVDDKGHEDFVVGVLYENVSAVNPALEHVVTQSRDMNARPSGHLGWGTKSKTHAPASWRESPDFLRERGVSVAVSANCELSAGRRNCDAMQ